MEQAYSVTMQPMETYERDLMKIFCCDPEWPLCLFDFTAKNKNPTFVALRTGRSLNEYRIDEYFYGGNSSKQPKSEMFQPGLVESTCRDDLLLERLPHLCCSKEYPFFVHNFKIRY